MLAAKINKGIQKIKKNTYKEGKLKRRFQTKSLYKNYFILCQNTKFFKITIEKVKQLLITRLKIYLYFNQVLKTKSKNCNKLINHFNILQPLY